MQLNKEITKTGKYNNQSFKEMANTMQEHMKLIEMKKVLNIKIN